MTSKIKSFDEWCQAYDPLQSNNGSPHVFDRTPGELPMPDNELWSIISVENEKFLVTGNHSNALGYMITTYGPKTSEVAQYIH